jgi:4-hydroxybenzoate polyprenyltransferase
MISTATATPAEVASRFRGSHDRGRAIGELCRMHIARTPAAIVVVGGLASGAGLRTITAGVTLVVSTCAIAAALNDRADVVSDRVNGRSDRPLVSGAATDRDVVAVIIVASIVALLALAALPQPSGLVIAAAACFIAWASACEPLHLQRRGFVGLVALATGYLVLPILLVTGLDRLLIVAPLALIGAGALAHKDVRDELGDRASGKQTFLIRVGARRMTWISALAALAGSGALSVTLGPGWWLVPGAATTATLTTMAVRGHDAPTWMRARVSLVALALSVAWAAASAMP